MASRLLKETDLWTFQFEGKERSSAWGPDFERHLFFGVLSENGILMKCSRKCPGKLPGRLVRCSKCTWREADRRYLPKTR